MSLKIHKPRGHSAARPPEPIRKRGRDESASSYGLYLIQWWRGEVKHGRTPQEIHAQAVQAGVSLRELVAECPELQAILDGLKGKAAARNGKAAGKPSANGKHARHAAHGAIDLGPLPQVMLELDQLLDCPFNPRKTFPPDEVARVAESMKSVGVLQPLLVRPAPGFELLPGKMGSRDGWHWENPGQKLHFGFHLTREAAEAHPPYELIFGHVRRRAAEAAGLKAVPCKVYPCSDRVAAEIQIEENEERLEVAPLERAAGYANLLKLHKGSVESAADAVAVSASTFRDVLRWLDAPEPLREALARGEVEPSVVGLVARLPEPMRAGAAEWVLAGANDWDPLTASAARRAYSVREVKAHLRSEYMVELKQAPFSPRAKDLAGAVPCQDCPRRLGNLVKTDPAYADCTNRGDLCTDPVCFRAKAAAWQAKTIAKAGAAGQVVLSDEEAARLFPWGSQLASSAPFVDLAALCWLLHGVQAQGSITWGDALRPHLAKSDIILAFPRGEMHELVYKNTAEPLLYKHHKVDAGLGPANGTAGGARGQPSRDAQDEKRRRDAARLELAGKKALLATARHAAAELFAADAKQRGGAQDEVLRAVARELIDAGYGEVRKLVAEGNRLRAATVEELELALDEHLMGLRGPALYGLLAELALAGTAFSATPRGGVIAGQILAALGVDRKAAVESGQRCARADADAEAATKTDERADRREGKKILREAKIGGGS